MKQAREGEAGMILVNVLMFVAIASGLVLLLINREELALDRALRTREAARALAVVRGGELSAVVALRRDMVVAPMRTISPSPGRDCRRAVRRSRVAVSISRSRMPRAAST